MKNFTNFGILRFLSPFFFLFLLTACEGSGPTIAKICETHPNFCDGLNQDEWCRAEKAEIIRQRFDHKDDKNDAYIYPLILSWEDYEQCVERATGIKHIKYRNKEGERVKGYMTAQKELKRLSFITRNSNDPYLQYYQWSRHGNEEAKKSFMAKAKRNEFKDPDLWLKVAGIHLKRDNDKALQALYKTISYYSDIDEIAPEVYESFITVSLDEERYASAYTWAKVYASAHEQGEKVLENTKPMVMAPIKTSNLDLVADKVEDAINDGEFNAERLGLGRIDS